MAAVLADVWGDEETLVLVSSDLSHYLPYDEARAVDAETITAILRNEATLTGEQACGCIGINGLTFLARQRGARIDEIARCNSGDTGRRSQSSGGLRSVLAARVCCMSLSPAQRSELLSLARTSIEASLPTGERAPYDGPPLHADLTRPGSSFVTLRVGEDLRGCCGTIEATRPLARGCLEQRVRLRVRRSAISGAHAGRMEWHRHRDLGAAASPSVVTCAARRSCWKCYARGSTV